MKINAETQKKKQDMAVDSLYQKDAQTTYNICKVCEGYDTCTFPMNMSRPILHCAEFKPFSSRGAVEKTGPAAAVKTDTPVSEEVEYVGICRNCDLRHECVNCKPGKYMLNCGEYQ